jgi:Fe-S-cluster containining protein
MKLKYLCKIYKDRPQWCKDYPWGDGYDENDYHKGCQFFDHENNKLLSEEEVLKTKTKEEIEEACVSCGMCCNYWENGEPILACSALQAVDEQGKVVYETPDPPEDEQDAATSEKPD